MTRREILQAGLGAIGGICGWMLMGQKGAEPKPEPAVLRDPLLEAIRSGKGKWQRTTAVAETKIEAPLYPTPDGLDEMRGLAQFYETVMQERIS